ncbi:MAG: hypothetical protein K2X93_03055 [Candidatus Obscuribacterales bacterium]|nr:hypothetical protein [Candidatus Obscuribacterales bacterium]
MLNRSVLIAMGAALIAVTGYGLAGMTDSASIACAEKSIKAFFQNPETLFQTKQSSLVVAQKYGGTDPHGPDPHGDDPHDEVHDPKLPANAERNFGKAPKDVYGDTVPNSQQPY